MALDLLTQVLSSGVPNPSTPQIIPTPQIAPLMCVASHGAQNSTLVATTAANIAWESRKLFKFTNSPVTELRFVTSNYIVNTSGTGAETTPGNVVNEQAALEYNGVVVQFTFNGSTAPVALADGAFDVVSDPIYPFQFGLTTFPAGTTGYTRVRRTVTSGQNHLRHAFSSDTGEQSISGDGTAASQLLTAGAYNSTGQTNFNAALMGPNVLIGRVLGTPDISVLIFGDSLADGSNDSNAAGIGMSSGATAGAGFMARALWNSNGRSIPFSKIATGGTTVNTFLTAFTRRRAMFKYHTHAWISYGTNDSVVLGRTMAQVLTDLKLLFAILRGPDTQIRHIAWNGIINRCATTDAGVTVVNQTPRPGFEIGGNFRQPLNAAVATYASPLTVDDVLDINPVIADYSFPDRWQANISSDTIHPSAIVADALRAAVQSKVNSWY